jgi:hypothetical protein
LKADNTDEHTVRKQEEVLQETINMLPDSTKRLDAAILDLTDHMVRYVTYNTYILVTHINYVQKIVEQSSCAASIAGTEDWLAAKQLLG